MQDDNPNAADYAEYKNKVHEIYEDMYPNVTLKFENFGWDEALRQNLVTALLGRHSP